MPNGDYAVPTPIPAAPAGEELKLIRALVDHDNAVELRVALVEAGPVQIVVSEASLCTPTSRVVLAIQRFPGASASLQVIDAHLTATP
jgi:hypothetical protein